MSGVFALLQRLLIAPGRVLLTTVSCSICLLIPILLATMDRWRCAGALARRTAYAGDSPILRWATTPGACNACTMRIASDALRSSLTIADNTRHYALRAAGAVCRTGLATLPPPTTYPPPLPPPSTCNVKPYSFRFLTKLIALTTVAAIRHLFVYCRYSILPPRSAAAAFCVVVIT